MRYLCAMPLQSCPTLCDPMDCSPPGSSVHGTLQARTLEWRCNSFVVFVGLGPHCSMLAFSSWGQELLLMQSTASRMPSLSSCGAQAQLPHAMWDLSSLKERERSNPFSLLREADSQPRDHQKMHFYLSPCSIPSSFCWLKRTFHLIIPFFLSMTTFKKTEQLFSYPDLVSHEGLCFSLYLCYGLNIVSPQNS